MGEWVGGEKGGGPCAAAARTMRLTRSGFCAQSCVTGSVECRYLSCPDVVGGIGRVTTFKSPCCCYLASTACTGELAEDLRCA